MGFLISVIIPVYKVEKYLDRCVESIVNQTYKNLEIILVDDGSPDNCPAMCDEWAKKDSRIKVIHKENGGVSSARNAGIEQASGEYIGFVDSDDTIESDFYEILINDAILNCCDIVCCDFDCVDENYNISENRNLLYQDYRFFNSRELCEEFFYSCKGVWVSLCNKIIKKSLFQNLSFPIDRTFEDWTLAPIIYSKANLIEYIPVKKYNYLIRQNSAMRTETLKRYADCVFADYDHYLYFKSNEVLVKQIFNFVCCDFKKCIKVGIKSKNDKILLKECYLKYKCIGKNNIIEIMYMFPRFFHFLYKVRSIFS